MDWHGIPAAIWAGLFSIVGALIGAIAGSLIAPYFNFLFNSRLKQKDKEIADRARQADLYKTIYPEKFRATKELMDKAASVYSLTGKILVTAPIKNQIDVDVEADIKQLAASVYELRLQAGAAGWLVSDDIRKQIDALGVSCLDTLGLTNYGAGYDKVKSNYAVLCSKVREQLLMDELDKLHSISGNFPSTKITK